MQTQTMQDRVRDFVLRQFPLVRKQGLKAGDKWLESGILDSLGILDLVHFLEEEFSLQIADDELLPENFESLESVVTFVRKKTGNA